MTSLFSAEQIIEWARLRELYLNAVWGNANGETGLPKSCFEPFRPKPYMHDGTYVCKETYLVNVVVSEREGKCDYS